MAAIELVPIFLAGRRELLVPLAARLGHVFGVDVAPRARSFDPDEAYDASRGQYNSTLLLRRLLDDGGDRRVLGVAGVDLFVPVLTWVFGEAQLGGRAAVVSLHRLRNEPYGLPADEALLCERLAKEAIHELGHTYGLLHCLDPRCAMRASTYVEEIDLKPARFCSACLARIRPDQPKVLSTSQNAPQATTASDATRAAGANSTARR